MKKAVCLTLSVYLMATVAYGDDLQNEGPTFWEKIRAKIETITPKQKQLATTAVGGVRGAKNDAGDDLYWKGEEEGGVIDADELDAFTKGVTLVEQSNKAQAITQFEIFVTSYPKSALLGDAREAIRVLQVGQ